MHTWSNSSILLFIDSVAIAIAQGYMLARARLVSHPSPVVRLAAARDAAVWDAALLERELAVFRQERERIPAKQRLSIARMSSEAFASPDIKRFSTIEFECEAYCNAAGTRSLFANNMGRRVCCVKPLGSRCPSVSVMKTTDLFDRNNVTSLGRVDLTGYRRVSFQ